MSTNVASPSQPGTPPGAVGQAGSFTLEPRAPFPNIVVRRPDKPSEFYQPDAFRAAFPQVEERVVKWLLNREIAGTGIENCVDAHLYTAEDCARDAALDVLAALKDILQNNEEYVRINNLCGKDGGPATTHSMNMARAAIAKATGARVHDESDYVSAQEKAAAAIAEGQEIEREERYAAEGGAA